MQSVHFKFINYLAYGYNMQEIQSKISNVFTVKRLKQEVLEELNAENILEIIFMAYEKRLFYVSDYFKQKLKEIAFATAYNIFLNETHVGENENLRSIYEKTYAVYKEIERNEQTNYVLTKVLFNLNLSTMEAENNIKELSPKEEFFIKLLAHNCSDYEMENFLDTNKNQRQLIFMQLKSKLHTTGCYDTIKKAFSIGLLKEYDFIHEVVKKEIIETTAKIEFYHKTLELDEDLLKKMINTMLEKSRDNLKSYYLTTIDLSQISQTEIDYLKMLFEGQNKMTTAKELKLSIHQAFYELKNQLFQKLNVNSYYNAFKKAFELELFNDSKEAYSKRVEIKATVNKIMNSKESLQYESKFYNEQIYRLLVDCYCKIKYKSLHRRYKKTKITTNVA